MDGSRPHPAPPFDVVLQRSRELLRRFHVAHEFALPASTGGGAFPPGLLRWLNGGADEGPRRQVVEALTERLHESSLADLTVPAPARTTLGRLVDLCRVLRLEPEEELLLCLLLGAELSPRVCWSARLLSGRSDLRGLDIGFVRHLLDPLAERSWAVARALGPDAPLFCFGLVREATPGPASEPGWIRLAPALVRFLLGHDWTDPATDRFVRVHRPDAAVLENLEAVHPVSPAACQEARETIIDPGRPLLVAGPRGSGADLLVRWVAQRERRDLVILDLEALLSTEDGRDVADPIVRAAAGRAACCGALLLVEHVDAAFRGDTPPPVEIVLRQVLAAAPVPVAVSGGPASEGVIAARLAPMSFHLLPLSLPDPVERQRIWTAALGRLAPAGTDVAAVANALKGYPIGGGQVLDACRTAISPGHAPEPLDVAHLQALCRDATGHRLGSLTARVETRATWSQVVLPPRTRQAIDELLAHARHVHQVLSEWNFGPRLNWSAALSALFSGPPGTGKTLVAGLIARELGLELYRVDLARVVSKYIGETEERLGRLFDEAKAGGVCLLFDEADALFSKRTEVRSSVDRYANLEVDFLLQKMEEFEGVTILTTNFPQSIDEAFLRRIKFRVLFPKPDVNERSNLWRSMLPPEAPVEAGIPFDSLAVAYEFTGAEIRNAVLRAAFLAAEGGGLITLDLLDDAARTECEQAGRIVTRIARDILVPS